MHFLALRKQYTEPFLSLLTFEHTSPVLLLVPRLISGGCNITGLQNQLKLTGRSLNCWVFCTQAQALLGNIRVVVVYKSVPWSNQLYGKTSQTLVLLSVCVFFGKISHCDNNKNLRSFGIFLRRVIFFKMLKFWKNLPNFGNHKIEK